MSAPAGSGPGGGSTSAGSGGASTGSNTTYDAAGHILTETDSSGVTTAWTYDAAGHVTSKTVAAGTSMAAKTTYTWDGNNLVQVTDPNGNVTSYGYDAQGRVTSMTDPLGHTETTSYDANGRVASVTNRNGLRRDMTYDAAGHLTSEVWYAADQTTVVDTFTFTYNSAGQLTSASNSAGTYTLSYDTNGNLTHVDEPFGVSLNFGYDASGNRTSVTDSFGGTTTSAYDAAGRLVSRTFAAAGEPTLRVDRAYDSQGRLVQETRSDNAQVAATTAYSYDAAGQLTGLVHSSGTGATIANYSYQYDSSMPSQGSFSGAPAAALGSGSTASRRLVSQTDHGVTHNYSYDAQGQLTGDGSNTYSYDLNGNRTMAGYVTGAGNELLSDGTWDYQYDNDGNVIKKVNIATGETWAYAYDNEDHMVSAKHSASDGGAVDKEADFRYDAFGNRVEEDVTQGGSTNVTKFALDGWNSAKGKAVGNENWDVWADLNGNGSLATRYLRGDAVDEVFARIGQDGSAYWDLTDQSGSVRDVVDGSGQVKDSISYDAFGNITSETDAAYGGRYKYTGREYDAATGLQYNRARYYDATTGRWTGQDRMGFAAGDSNLYRYVFNKPNTDTDPSGFQDPGPASATIPIKHPFNNSGKELFKVSTEISKDGKKLIIKVQEGKDFAGEVKNKHGFSFQQVIKGDTIKYDDLDSAQGAVGFYDKDGKLLKRKTNAVDPRLGDKRTEGATWKFEKDKKSGIETATWEVDIPENTTKIEALVVYTDILYSNPGNANKFNKYGDVPAIIGSFTAELKDKKWTLTPNDKEVIQPNSGEPVLKDYKKRIEDVRDLLKKKTGFNLLARPFDIQEKPVTIYGGPDADNDIRAIQRMMRDAIDAKLILGRNDSGFDVVDPDAPDPRKKK
jgi:RHS repeat-associated protein